MCSSDLWTDGGDLSHTFTASADQTVVAAEFQEFFKVSATATGSGTVTVEPSSPDGYYRSGTTVKITARPGSGQALYSWFGTQVQSYGFGYSAEVLTIPVRDPLTLEAQFSASPMVLVDSDPPGADVSVDSVSYLTPVRFRWTAGTTHTLSASTPLYTPTGASKFVFQQWEDASTGTSRSIQAPATSATYKSTYSTLHFLNYDWLGSGSVAANPSGSAYYNVGTSVTLTALPRSNQQLQYWLGTGIGGGALNQTMVMNRPKFALAKIGRAHV